MKTIFYDVDTQNDFMNKDGALYVPDAELIKPALAKLTKYACEQGIPIFGSVDRHFGTPEYKHREAELQRNGGPFPDHCMDGTDGQRKIGETTSVFVHPLWSFFDVSVVFIENNLQGKSTVIKENFNYLSDNPTIKRTKLSNNNLQERLRTFITDKTRQSVKNYKLDRTGDESYNTIPGIFFEKQHYDVATNPWFEKTMRAIAPEKAIVYGVATDYCVKAGVLALKKAGVPEVYVVTDAIRGITPDGSKLALEEMVTAGAKLTNLEQVLRGGLK